jgi:O-antigen/teichoic acid export membrane protein
MQKLVAKNFLIYSLPTVLSRFVPIITLPITTKYLNLSDFGYIAVFELCAIPFQMFMSIGQGYVINSMWYKLDKVDRGKLIFSLLILTLALAGLGIMVLWIMSNQIFPLLAGDIWPELLPLLPLLFLSALAMVPNAIFTSWVIIEQKARLSSTIKIANIVIASTSLVLIAVYTQNYRLVILGNVLIQIFISILQLIALKNEIRVIFERKWFSLIYSIGSPIFLRSIFNILRTQVDRILVSSLFGVNQFAIYNFSGKINNMFALAGENYQNAYDPVIYKGLADGELEPSYLRSLFFSWSYLLILAFSTLIIFGEKVIGVLTNGIFTDAYPLVLLYSCVVVVALPFMGNGQVIIFFKKTEYLLAITVVQAVLITALAYTLIPTYGASAGIFSFWVGSLAYFLMYYYKKRQLFGDFFVEKIMVPYVILYHITIIFVYYKATGIAYVLMIILIGSMTVKMYRMHVANIQQVKLRMVNYFFKR